ncbi:MAG: NAD(P)H-dependent oxidoreductase [Bacteroidia bacterium]|nr:NAD(P)H-dependent oxidoreductase [Bacteroidia bacterium]NNC86614.1 NAD(P)H-dependent oxidoreductase [Bacteroidia bacterium]
MKKILAFGASNSKNSINKMLAYYAANQLNNVDKTLIDLNDFDMPVYGIDREHENGIPALAKQFKLLVKDSDGIIISFAEHNGNFSVAFKNVMDWMSRLEGKIWENKKMFVLATSPGARGGKSALEIALNTLPHRAADIVANFSLPSFKNNFSEEEGITDPELKTEFENQLKAFESSL